jgi:phage repressor protein C with HTH and peptisase S24 domain
MQEKRAKNDNAPIGQRLKLEMKKRSLSSVDLARRADVKTSFIYDIISGKSANPSSVKLARVAESLGVSLAYLAGGSDGGEGYSFAIASSSSEFVNLLRIRAENTAEGVKLISRDEPSENYQFRKDWIKNRFNVASTDLRLISMHGDSMQPTFSHNDLLMVDLTQKHPSPPGIFLLFDGMGLSVKRVDYISHPSNPKARIISDNSQYSTYERSMTEVTLIGRVVWFAREI